MCIFARNMEYKGLTDAEVVASRAAHGRNILTPPAKKSLWKEFFQTLTGPLGQFVPGWSNGDSLVFILEIAALLSVFTSCAEYWGWIGLMPSYDAKVFFEPIGIIAAIVLATGISFYFENKAQNEFAILNQVNDEEKVQVIRNGQAQKVPKCDIVVGDIIILSTGDEVPADALLLESVSMSVDESSLTGEPLCTKYAVLKGTEAEKEATFPVNQVMRGTKIMEGNGIARVFAVGDSTENGKVFVAAQLDNNVKTPLDEQFDKLGKFISAASFVVGALIIAGSIVSYGCTEGKSFSDPSFLPYLLKTMMIAVTLVVCAVPEGLPMAVTLSLALSMRRMLKTNNLVRKMHACETMGATTVICTDKTGTLTQNKMRVVAPDCFPEASEWVYGIAVNSTAMLNFSNEQHPEALGNPTEGALLLWLYEQGIDYRELREKAEIVAQQPFSTETKLMWTEVRYGTETIKYIKGAPEYVCPSFASEAAEYQQKGMRTLGFAYERDGERTELGVVAIADPVRPDVPAAVKEVMDAGIRVIMVTGDSEKTAKEIGRQIGIPETDVIFRARPMDKRDLVERLQKEGNVVAVTGDGTNDAPALKAAHVGLSMGDGTSVAKEASDITIIDNSFTSIGRAVMWGRSLFQNIQRFILFQLTVNVSACLVVLIGAFMGTEPPLTVTQMLWINLIMDTFAAMALASLPPSSSVMKDRPRDRNAFIISRKMGLSILLCGGFFTLVLLGMLYVFEHQAHDITSMTAFFHASTYTTLGEHTLAGSYELSLLFTTFVMFQFWNLFNARAFCTGKSAFQLKDCRGFTGIALAIIIGQIVIISIGGEFFNVEPISLSDWLIISALTSVVLWLGEATRIHR